MQEAREKSTRQMPDKVVGEWEPDRDKARTDCSLLKTMGRGSKKNGGRRTLTSWLCSAAAAHSAVWLPKGMEGSKMLSSTMSSFEAMAEKTSFKKKEKEKNGAQENFLKQVTSDAYCSSR